MDGRVTLLVSVAEAARRVGVRVEGAGFLAGCFDGGEPRPGDVPDAGAVDVEAATGEHFGLEAVPPHPGLLFVRAEADVFPFPICPDVSEPLAAAGLPGAASGVTVEATPVPAFLDESHGASPAFGGDTSGFGETRSPQTLHGSGLHHPAHAHPAHGIRPEDPGRFIPPPPGAFEGDGS